MGLQSDFQAVDQKVQGNKTRQGWGITIPWTNIPSRVACKAVVFFPQVPCKKEKTTAMQVNPGRVVLILLYVVICTYQSLKCK